jgi:hypothetical protein
MVVFVVVVVARSFKVFCSRAQTFKNRYSCFVHSPLFALCTFIIRIVINK